MKGKVEQQSRIEGKNGIVERGRYFKIQHKHNY